ncbi:MAG: AraC family transcriptional regulator [Planctomycetota bacterium]
MARPPKNLTVIFPHLSKWNRGGASLDPDRPAFPRLLHATWQQNAPLGANRKGHTHDVYHVCLTHAGVSSMLLEGVDYTTQPGSLVLVSPRQNHSFVVPSDAGSVYSEVTFEVVDKTGQPHQTPLSKLLTQWSGQAVEQWPTGAVISAGMQERVDEKIRHIVSSCQLSGPGQAFAVNRGLLDLLETVAQIGGKQPTAQPPAEIAAHLIEQQLDQSLVVSEIAKEVGLSTNHLIRCFRERYGVTPLAYRQMLRIDVAKRLLATTRGPIKVVADRAGFNDVYYFTRLFSAKVGITPGAYRKQNLAPPRDANSADDDA